MKSSNSDLFTRPQTTRADQTAASTPQEQMGARLAGEKSEGGARKSPGGTQEPAGAPSQPEPNKPGDEEGGRKRSIVYPEPSTWAAAQGCWRHKLNNEGDPGVSHFLGQK